MTTREMPLKAHYDIYINTIGTGLILAAECVIEEQQGVVCQTGFRYRPDYLHHPNAFSIDPNALPLTAGEVRLPCKGGIPGFLDDYLPDAWGRKVLTRLAYYRKQERFNANSVIDTLALLGNSRIGSLSIVPKGEAPCYDMGLPIEELAKLQLAAQHIEDVDYTDMCSDDMNLLYLASSGSGVGGARPKALVSIGQSAYLAKFNRLTLDDYNNARVELACLKMARAAGISMRDGQVKSGINGREVLLLERFDINGEHRNHLITINALLKESSSQRDGGGVFRYDDIHKILQHHSTCVERDLEQLLKLMLFNRAINNADDHERNFSLINTGEGYHFAPAYDLVPTIVTGQYPAAGFLHSPFSPRLSEAVSLGKIFGLPKTVVSRCVEEVKTQIDNWETFAELAGVNEEESQRIKRYFCV